MDPNCGDSVTPIVEKLLQNRGGGGARLWVFSAGWGDCLADCEANAVMSYLAFDRDHIWGKDCEGELHSLLP